MLNKKEQMEVRVLLRNVVNASLEMEAITGDNPQIVAIRKKAAAERELADAVISALGGDLVPLKLYAKGL